MVSSIALFFSSAVLFKILSPSGTACFCSSFISTDSSFLLSSFASFSFPSEDSAFSSDEISCAELFVSLVPAISLEVLALLSSKFWLASGCCCLSLSLTFSIGFSLSEVLSESGIWVFSSVTVVESPAAVVSSSCFSGTGCTD